MTFLFPWFAVAGVAAALAVVAAHLITERARQPRTLPTARFVTPARVSSAMVERRPRDLLLMTLRSLVLLAAGLALARPVFAPPAREPVRLVIADFAGAHDSAEVRDSAVAAGNGRVIEWRASRSLTGALLTAYTEAQELAARGHEVGLSVVSPFTAASVDSATLAVRALWPSRIALVPVAAPPPDRRATSVVIRGASDDVLLASLSLAGSPPGAPDTVWISRDAIDPADAALAARGHAVVHWPRAGGTELFDRAPTADTSYGIAVEGYTLVAPLERSAHLASDHDTATGVRVIARWVDGEPAALERNVGAGCMREIGFAAPEDGDLPLSSGFLRVLRSLTAPCGAMRRDTALTTRERAALAGSGAEFASLRPVRAGISGVAVLSQALLVLALALLAGEMVVRRFR